MVIRVGVLGFNDGNGHPFSYSAILNGYREDALREAGWSVIAEYLAAQPPTAFADLGARVTCVWGPDPAVTGRLRDTCSIDTIVDSPDAMVGHVDAAIIARDDWQCHLPLAQPFLAARIPVFVDKPLTLSQQQLQILRPNIEVGSLASWSGLRFSPELSDVEVDDHVVALRGVSVEDWDTYAIHVVEPALNIMPGAPYAATAFKGKHQAVVFEMDDERLLYVDVLGRGARTGFSVDVLGTARVEHIRLVDRFTAFKRSLSAFIGMVRNGQPAIPADQTIGALKAIIAGRVALDERRRVLLSEVSA